MPQNSALWGLAFLALVFAPGAEALICAENQYLHVNAGATAVACAACPDSMTSAAGVAGGRGDSADPRIAIKVAALSANTVLTYCNVPAGRYLSTAISSTDIGASSACTASGITFGQTTSVEHVISYTTGAAGVGVTNSEKVRCLQQSKCAANKYLNLAAHASARVTVTCESCHAGMSAVAGASQPLQDVISAGIISTANAIVVGTYCNVPAGRYLSTATTAALIGASSACTASGITFGQTTSVEHVITPALGTAGVTNANS